MIALFVEGTMNVLKHCGILGGPMGRTAKDVRVYVGNSVFPILATAGVLVEFLARLSAPGRMRRSECLSLNSRGTSQLSREQQDGRGVEKSGA
jgi:uncharacterized protein